jgi:dipeptidyl aminopeptidase/acylaminoacyl peptidase
VGRTGLDTTMKRAILALLLGSSLTGAVLLVSQAREGGLIVSPQVERVLPQEKPLRKYTLRSLRESGFPGSEINLSEALKEDERFTSYLFYFTSDSKKVSGLANVPKEAGVYPVIVMFRGYVDQEIYEAGIGTKNTAEAFTRQGFITLAPDFLGYGESDFPSDNPMEERFETYTTALNLLASVKTLPKALAIIEAKGVRVAIKKVGIWGHSNGGQIALAALEITGRPYPTVLWAPVSKPFPYSILYYTDEFEDRGKTLRRVLAEFEKEYDVEEYNPINFFDWISAPVQLHQGSDDEAVPQQWSDELYTLLGESDVEVSYYTYPDEDHNFTRGSWSEAVSRSTSFFRENFVD